MKNAYISRLLIYRARARRLAKNVNKTMGRRREDCIISHTDVLYLQRGHVLRGTRDSTIFVAIYDSLISAHSLIYYRRASIFLIAAVGTSTAHNNYTALLFVYTNVHSTFVCIIYEMLL